MTPVLRPMRWWDIEPVLDLELDLFADDAWSAGMFWSDLADTRHPGASRYYVVAEEPAAAPGEAPGEAPEPGEAPGGVPAGAPAPRLVGYAGLMAVAGQADVLTIGVARDHWGGGLGSRLLTDLLRQATAFECDDVLLEVRVDNTRAQRLYQRFGFEPVGVRRGYYAGGAVDALVMRLTDPGAEHGPAAVGAHGTHDAPDPTPTTETP